MARNERSARHLRWTAAETATLRREWSQVQMKHLRQLLPGRSLVAIRKRAQKLGLGNSQTQGMLSVYALAQRFGLARATMHKVLERAGVRLARQHPCGGTIESRRKFWKLYADLDDARAAFERWEREETAEFAAQRLGASGRTLRLRALSAGLVTFGAPARLLPEQWDELAAPKRARRTGAALQRRKDREAA